MSDQKIVISESKKYIVFIGLALISIGIGLFFHQTMDTENGLLAGYWEMVQAPGIIDYDSFAHAKNHGSPYVNSGLMLLATLLIFKITKTTIQGVHIAAAMQVVGFAFYGKDLSNIWFTIIGVFAHTAYMKKPLSSASHIAIFSTALSPIFSTTFFGEAGIGSGSLQAFILAAVLGILAGVLVSILAGHLPALHNGYTLFNVGLAAGFVGMLVYSLKMRLDIVHTARDNVIYFEHLHYTTGENLPLGITLFIMFLYLIIMGFAFGGGKEIKNMIWHKAKGGNFVEKFGFAPSLINMGIMGIISTVYVFITGGHLNGALFACIWTALGFAANGVSVRMYLPTMLGVAIAAFFTGGIQGAVASGDFLTGALSRVGSRGMLLAAIFSCGMAAVVGAHGALAGILVGFVHAILVPSTAQFHGWMSLYNNGFSLSIVVILLYPIYSKMGLPKEQPPAAK